MLKLVRAGARCRRKRRHFTHLKTSEAVKDTTALLTVILADGINLGLTKMAESCPGTSYAKLAWLQGWHARDETYTAALAELVNAQSRQPFAGHWGDGSTTSSDGQRFRAGGKAESTGHVNPKYGSEPGRLFYTRLIQDYLAQININHTVRYTETAAFRFEGLWK